MPVGFFERFDERITARDHAMLEFCRMLLRDVRLDTTTLPIERMTFEADSGGLSLVTAMLVPDRGKPDVDRISVFMRSRLSWEQLAGRDLAEYVLGFLRRQVKEMMTHEVDECLFVNGERRFDPHAVAEVIEGKLTLPPL